jgi:hypothetical protein
LQHIADVGDEKRMINDHDVIPKYVESRSDHRDNTKVKSTSGIKIMGESVILDGNRPKNQRAFPATNIWWRIGKRLFILTRSNSDEH